MIRSGDSRKRGEARDRLTGNAFTILPTARSNLSFFFALYFFLGAGEMFVPAPPPNEVLFVGVICPSTSSSLERIEMLLLGVVPKFVEVLRVSGDSSANE